MAETKDTLRKLAREACEKHASVEAAVAATLGAVNEHPGLRDGLLLDVIHFAVTDAVYDARHKMRSDLKAGACRTNVETMAGAKGIFAKALLDSWFFPDGMPLRLATLAVLEYWETWSAEKEQGFAHDRRLYAGLKARLRGKQTVGGKWTEQEVTALWAEIAGSGTGPASN